jgi:predicted branched-subunit amino acid permease
MWDQAVLSLNLVTDESWAVVVMQRRQKSNADLRFLASKITSNGSKNKKNEF